MYIMFRKSPIKIYMKLIKVVTPPPRQQWADEETSGQDGGAGKHASPPRTTVAKITTKLQIKHHAGSSENRAVWKSDNQGL